MKNNPLIQTTERLAPFDKEGKAILSPDGLTLRDYFAAKAMTALIMTQMTQNPNSRAEMSYHYADAMLAQRLIH